MNRRVVVTGMGIVSSAGCGLAAFAEAVRNGVSCLQTIDASATEHLRTRYAGVARDFDARRVLREAAVPETLDRHVALALAAGREALVQAQLLPMPANLRVGIVSATCSGAMVTTERLYERALTAPPCDLTDEEYFVTRYWSAARVLAHVFGISGPNLTVTTACSASANAIGTACDLISLGTVDVVLAGGADALSLTTLAGFEGLKATCEGRCAPFSKPLGMNLGEAGAFAVLEELDSARKRGVPVLAEVLGFGSSNDAYHVTAPDPSGRGPAVAMKRALADACLPPEAITYVNAHGTGTEANDKAETRAARTVFGAAASRLPMSSIKGVTGHCLGAAGMLEVIASVVCSRKGVLPPTANFSVARDGCDLDYVAHPGRPWQPPGPFMSNNLAFGGNNASLILGTTLARVADTAPLPAESVYISSCGVVSGVGVGAKAFAQGVEELTGQGSVGERVREADLRPFERRLDTRGMDRASRFAVAASSLSLEQAGLGGRRSDRSDVGLFMACSHAPVWAEAEHIGGLLRDNYRMDHLTAFPYLVPNSVTGNVCRALGLTGHSATFCLGPGGGLTTLGMSFRAVQNRRSGLLMCGSSDEPASGPLGEAFGRGGSAEAGVMLLLEGAAHLRDRGGTPLARLCGFACSVDTTHPWRGDSAGTRLAAVVQAALAEAGVAGAEVSAVCGDAGNASVADVLEWLVPSWRQKTHDVGSVTGRAETSGELLTLCWLLQQRDFRNSERRKYILSLFRTPYGYNTALVVACGGPVPRE